MSKEYILLEGTPKTSETVAVGSSSTKILAANTGRKYAMICNDSNEAIYINFGGAAVQGKGIRLSVPGTGNDRLVIDTNNLHRGDIYAICASGAKAVTVFEY